MRVYCPVCHKRYGQTKLEKDQSVDFQCECGTYLWLDQINGRDRIKWIEEKDLLGLQRQKIRHIPLDKVSPKAVSCDSEIKRVEAKLDLDIIKQRLDEGEKAILDYMAEGYSADDIGHIMGISRQLVNYRFKKIQIKIKDFQKR